MNEKFNRKMIFDLGMHRAKDTDFYLNKGFNVVALECNPVLAEDARTSYAEHISSGRLSIIEKALWENDNESIDFFLNSEKDDWSSLIKKWAEKGGHTSTQIAVQTTTLGNIFDQFGTPYYIKCDIEGADNLFTIQLLNDRRRPPFISVEAMSLDLLSNLKAAGYDRFQIINQMLNQQILPPNPPREGEFIDTKFDGHMSGLFALELEPKKWISFEEAANNYLAITAIQKRDPTLAPGWFDFHATESSMLPHL